MSKIPSRVEQEVALKRIWKKIKTADYVEVEAWDTLHIVRASAIISIFYNENLACYMAETYIRDFKIGAEFFKEEQCE